VQQLVPPQGYTAGRRRKSFPGNMKEDGAAAAGHARPRVMVDFDDQIVEGIVPAKAVAWFIGRPAECLVIAAVRGVLAPGVVVPYPAHRQQRSRPSQAIGPPPQADGVKPARRRATVALAFERLDAGAAQCNLRRLECRGAGE